MKEKVYLDSTVLSFYHDQRTDLKSWIDATREWWTVEKPKYECWISEAVILEIQEEGYPNREKVIQLAATIPVLETSPEIESAASYYVENYLMPKDLLGDAIHLAYASCLNFDYLLTWNCNHLANANKRKHIRVLNGRLGISTPEITTPLELVTEEK
jgi:predicted nucleic acid-binding protein